MNVAILDAGLESIDWVQSLAKVDHSYIAKQTVAPFKRLTPGLNLHLGEPGIRAQIKGGSIVDWGSGDIDDRESEVHQRHDIGFHQHGNYFSVDKGKLSTAPRFSPQLAELISPSSRRQQSFSV